MRRRQPEHRATGLAAFSKISRSLTEGLQLLQARFWLSPSFRDCLAGPLLVIPTGVPFPPAFQSQNLASTPQQASCSLQTLLFAGLRLHRLPIGEACILCMIWRQRLELLEALPSLVLSGSQPTIGPFHATS